MAETQSGAAEDFDPRSVDARAAVVEALDTADQATVAAEAEQESAETRARLCARMTYAGRCGFAKAGLLAYVANVLTDRAVTATVRVSWRQGLESGVFDVVKHVPAGSRVLVGCTRGGQIPAGDFSYAVVGCAPA